MEKHLIMPPADSMDLTRRLHMQEGNFVHEQKGLDLMMNRQTKNIVLAGMFLCLGLILPFLTAQLQSVGSMLLPMHYPVFLCGLICGWQYGLIVGFCTPLLRCFLFGMPQMPSAVSMAFELAVYGALCGYLFSKWHSLGGLYGSLIVSGIAGRIVWGIVQYFLLTSSGAPFTFQMFLASGFVQAVPGIILQLILIPLIMTGLSRSGFIASMKKSS